MANILKAWLDLKTDLHGVTALEYGLIASLIALVVIAGVTSLGGNISGVFARVAAQVST